MYFRRAQHAVLKILRQRKNAGMHSIHAQCLKFQVGDFKRRRIPIFNAVHSIYFFRAHARARERPGRPGSARA